MTNRLLAFAGVAMTALSAASSAHAQAKPAPLPPPGPAAAVQPQPQPVAQPLPQPAAQPQPAQPQPQATPSAPVQSGTGIQVVSAPGTVRLHFKTFRDKGTARIYARQPDGRFGFVCATPCAADVPLGAQLRATYNDHEDDPHDFDAASGYGNDVTVEIKGPSVGPVIGGAIMTGVGGASLLSGLILLAIKDQVKSSIYSESTYETLGYVLIGTGVGLVVGGLIWFASRSHEPRLEAYPYRGEEDYDDRRHDRRKRRSRADVFLSDEAAAKPRDVLLPVGAPTPLSWSVAF